MIFFVKYLSNQDKSRQNKITKLSIKLHMQIRAQNTQIYKTVIQMFSQTSPIYTKKQIHVQTTKLN